jgi:hypothetical protein
MTITLRFSGTADLVIYTHKSTKARQGLYLPCACVARVNKPIMSLLMQDKDGHIYRWDLRNMTGGPVREYKRPGVDSRHFQQVTCLAVDPRQKIVLSGGTDGIVCWDLQTGAPCRN